MDGLTLVVFILLHKLVENTAIVKMTPHRCNKRDLLQITRIKIAMKNLFMKHQRCSDHQFKQSIYFFIATARITTVLELFAFPSPSPCWRIQCEIIQKRVGMFEVAISCEYRVHNIFQANDIIPP